MHRTLLALSLTLLASSGIAQTAPATGAAAWPSKPIRLLVGFPAGSSPDLTARTLAEPLSRALGQPVIVENRAGASGNIAADLVAKATDEHTLGLLINGNMTIAKLLNPALPYDPLKDLAPVSLIGTAPLLLAAPHQPTGTTPAQWLAQARQSGQQLSYGSPGVGTVAHLGIEFLEVGDDFIGLSLIPETLALTTLGSKQVGAKVNVEADVMAKHIERLLEARKN
jgi:tripartite-type tricarboxylate transporter receptor subunit TctC